MLIIPQRLSHTAILELTENFMYVCIVCMCVYVLYVYFMYVYFMYVYCRDTGGLERVASITNSYYKFAEAGKLLI